MAHTGSDETVCMFRVRSFNVDIDQNMRTRKIEYILTTTVKDAGLQFLQLNELDGLRQKQLLSVPSVHVRLAESAADDGADQPAADSDDSSTTDDGADQPDVTSDAEPVIDEDRSRPYYLQITNNEITITSSKPPLQMCTREPPLRGSVRHDLTLRGELPSPSNSDPVAPENEYITPKKAYASEGQRPRKILTPTPKKIPFHKFIRM